MTAAVPPQAHPNGAQVARTRDATPAGATGAVSDSAATLPLGFPSERQSQLLERACSPAPAPGAGDDMRIHETGWDMTASARLQTTLRALREGATSEWTMPEFVQYLAFYKRRGKKTCDLLPAPARVHGASPCRPCADPRFTRRAHRVVLDVRHAP